jgi:hypothetical protein
MRAEDEHAESKAECESDDCSSSCSVDHKADSKAVEQDMEMAWEVTGRLVMGDDFIEEINEFMDRYLSYYSFSDALNSEIQL